MIDYTRTKSKAYIEGLLDKFMAGTSTLEEEDILSQYFAQDDIPAEWEQYRLLFAELEAMKPAEKPRRRWIGWVAAAAIVAGMIYLTVPSPQAEESQTSQLVAQADTAITETVVPDTTIRQKEDAKPIQRRKRSLRKSEPTIHDLDKAYALMAEAEQERLEAERQLEQCQQEIIDAQLAAYGYIPVMQEDGTMIYINEQTNYIAYEE